MVLGGREHELPIVVVTAVEELYRTGKLAPSLSNTKLVRSSIEKESTNTTYSVVSLTVLVCCNSSTSSTLSVSPQATVHAVEYHPGNYPISRPPVSEPILHFT
jgi:hypothetical protein